ncbi:hypothetical protein ENH_00004230 [Eimeria necatrix]|uniref:Uncharacterized protein n=1 Tax=Eimeria necatrix TaxID=51315 RepID=U6MMV1_9EIME|nr:hypothetical protein ENH_00004230 [Eimeria necatrix]CDJ65356.1 hypothetical protein ENH_00004230 [Eimeria necatrix]
MGNNPSHPTVPLDGYLAVRASIEARFSSASCDRQAAVPRECYSTAGGSLQAVTHRELQKLQRKQMRQEVRSSRGSSRASAAVLVEQVMAGTRLPATLSIAETTDTNSDGAPDEFEASETADEMLRGLSPSFTRAKAPHVRAQSPLPFPSMSHCSPTVSRAAETLKQQSSELSDCGRSRGSDPDPSCRATRLSAGQTSPSSTSNVQPPTPQQQPQPLSADLTLHANDDRHQRRASDRETTEASEGHTAGPLEGHVTGPPEGSSMRSPAECRAAEDLHGSATRPLEGGVRNVGRERAARGREGRGDGALAVQIEEAEMFCPLSPNSALGSCVPTTVAVERNQQSARERENTASVALPSRDITATGSVCYGPACNHSPFLEGRALQTLLPLLLGPSLGTAMGVCVHWFMKISNGLADMCSPITRDFEESYGKYFSPVIATLKQQALHTTDGKGARLDWVITAKVLPPAANNVLSLGYCFKYRHLSSTRDSYVFPDLTGSEQATDSACRWADASPSSWRSTLRGRQDEGQSPVAIVRPPSRGSGTPTGQCRREVPVFSVAVAQAGTSRRMWLHRDLCRFHGDETGQAVLTHLGPVCVGDLVEVPVALSNGIGVADVSTIRWLPLRVTRRASGSLTGSKALDAASRGLYEGCPLEIQYGEWFDSDQYRHMTTERLKRAECLEPELHHVSTSYSGIDVLVRRSLYKAVREGSVGAAAQRAWGLQCKVLPPDSPVVFPLTRRGLLHDRSTSLQLRVGDSLEYYLTIGGANF